MPTNAIRQAPARSTTTLGDLVVAVQDNTASGAESVAVITHLLESRRAEFLDGRRIRVALR